MPAITITPANVQPTATTQMRTVTLGSAVTAGQAVYKDAATQTYKLADADSAASALVEGITLGAGDIGQKCVIATGGDIDIGATLAVGEPYFLHTTAGGIGVRSELLAGDFPSFIGHATAADNLKLAIANSTTALAA